MSVMRSTYTRLLVVVIMVLSTLGTTTLVASPAANASSATFANQLEAAIHKYTNAQRRAHGRRVVVWGPCVDRYAEGWATHLASTSQFYHRSWRTIVRRCHKSYASETSPGTWRRAHRRTPWLAKFSGCGWTPRAIASICSPAGPASWVSARRSPAAVVGTSVQNFAS